MGIRKESTEVGIGDGETGLLALVWGTHRISHLLVDVERSDRPFEENHVSLAGWEVLPRLRKVRQRGRGTGRRTVSVALLREAIFFVQC